MNRDVEIFTPGGATGSIQLVHTGRTWSSTPTGTSCRTAAP